MMLLTKYQGFRPYGFRQKDFYNVFPIYAYVNNVNPGWGHFWPQGNNLNKLGRGQLSDATYQLSKLSVVGFSDKKIFPCFTYISLCNTYDPWGGAILGLRDIF